MLKRLSKREQFRLLTEKWEPVVRDAFLEAVADIRSNIQLKRIIERLENGDILGAIQAMNLDEAAFRPLDEAIRATYSAGGVASVAGMPELTGPDGYRAVIRFDVRNPEAERWLREESSNLVTRIVDEQRNSIREVLDESLKAGNNPRRAALDVVGRVDRAVGGRTGGVVGLSAPQARYVASARRELLSGDPAQLQNYLTRVRRDKRFDRTVAKAIRDKAPLPIDVVDRIVGRYSDSLLKLRGDTIALNETFFALNEAKMRSWYQVIESGSVALETLTKIWHDSRDGRVRHSHRAMNGQQVAFHEKFTTPSGAQLRYPHDPLAPTAETLGCRCWMEVKVDFLAEAIDE